MKAIKYKLLIMGRFFYVYITKYGNLKYIIEQIIMEEKMSANKRV